MQNVFLMCFDSTIELTCEKKQTNENINWFLCIRSALGVGAVGLAAVAKSAQGGGGYSGYSGGYPGNAVSYSYYPSTPSYVYSPPSPNYLGSPGFSGGPESVLTASAASTGIPYGPPAPVSNGYAAASSGYAAPSYSGFHKTVYVVCD